MFGVLLVKRLFAFLLPVAYHLRALFMMRKDYLTWCSFEFHDCQYSDDNIYKDIA